MIKTRNPFYSNIFGSTLDIKSNRLHICFLSFLPPGISGWYHSSIKSLHLTNFSNLVAKLLRFLNLRHLISNCKFLVYSLFFLLLSQGHLRITSLSNPINPSGIYVTSGQLRILRTFNPVNTSDAPSLYSHIMHIVNNTVIIFFSIFVIMYFAYHFHSHG
jgi:hypothetical protein